MKVQTVNTQIQKAFKLKSVKFNPQNNYATVDGYGNYFFNIITIEDRSFNEAAYKGSYYQFSLEMMEDKMCLSIILEREWDNDGETINELLIDYCKELPYTTEGIAEFKKQLQDFSRKACGFSMKQLNLVAQQFLLESLGL
tara:strand:- start:4590 stop:5012 length:423 start_codon:yes stop_codon:yes gene_type:complete